MSWDLLKTGTEWARNIGQLAHRIKESYTTSETDMRKLHTELDTRGMLRLQQQFQSFVWMDHWKIKMIGTAPQFYAITNSSDGTYNLIKGIPIHATSISFLSYPDKKPIVSIVYDSNRDVIFYADREVSRMNKKDIKTSANTDIEDASLSADPRGMKDALSDAKVFRRLGAFSLEVCLVSSGAMESLICLAPLDWAHFPAALHILKNAGGIATTVEGKDINFRMDVNSGSDVVASANKDIHMSILEKLKELQV